MELYIDYREILPAVKKFIKLADEANLSCEYKRFHWNSMQFEFKFWVKGDLSGNVYVTFIPTEDRKLPDCYIKTRIFGQIRELLESKQQLVLNFGEG